MGHVPPGSGKVAGSTRLSSDGNGGDNREQPGRRRRVADGAAALVLGDEEGVAVDVHQGRDDVERGGVVQARVVELDRRREPRGSLLHHRIRPIDLITVPEPPRGLPDL